LRSVVKVVVGVSWLGSVVKVRKKVIEQALLAEVEPQSAITFHLEPHTPGPATISIT